MGNNILLNTESVVEVNSSIWFFSEDYNGLYSLNKENGEVSFHGHVPGEEILKERLFTSLVQYNSRILLVPFNATKFYIYDITKEEYSEIEAPRGVLTTNNSHYMASTLVGKDAYIFGALEPNIIKIDMDNMQIKILDNPYVRIPHMNKGDAYFRNQVQYVDDFILSPLCNSAAIVKIFPQSDEVEVLTIEDSEEGYSGVFCDKESGVIWLSPRKANGFVVCCKMSGEILKKIRIESDDSRTLLVGITKLNGMITLLTGESKAFKNRNIDGVVILDENIDFVKTENEKIFYGIHNKGKLLVHYEEQNIAFDLLTTKAETPFENIFSINLIEENVSWKLEQFMDYLKMLIMTENE